MSNKEEKKDTASTNESKKGKKLTIVLITLIIACIILIILELTTHFISKTRHKILQAMGVESSIGNTSGNITNYGYVAEDNKYIYFMRMSDNGRYLGIYKLKKDNLLGEQEKLFESDADLAGINVINDYVFFVTLKKTNSEEVDNKIHRMKKDGSDHQVINDNEFNDACFQIYAINDRIYYIGSDECIWYMDFEGKNRTKLNNDQSGYVAITDKYIFYNLYKDEESEEITTYMMDLNGENSKEVNGKKMNNISVLDDYIYYANNEGYLYRIKTDGTDDKMLSDKVSYLSNVSKDGIFFIDYFYSDDTSEEPDGIAIYKMELDGSKITEIKRLNNTTNVIAIVENGLFYMDSYTNQLRTELISFDGKQNNLLFKLDYKDYYYADQTEGKSNNEENVNTQTSDDATNNSNTEN